jgi:oligoribonuclease (3'-5' exoribonuclease)
MPKKRNHQGFFVSIKRSNQTQDTADTEMYEFVTYVEEEFSVMTNTKKKNVMIMMMPTLKHFVSK